METYSTNELVYLRPKKTLSEAISERVEAAASLENPLRV
jgi:hypothetical protein